MKKYLPLFIITPLVILLDQWTKLWVIARIPIGKSIDVISGYFELVHIKNPGAAFGMLAGWNTRGRLYFFYVLSFVAMAVLFGLYAKTHPKERKVQIPLALILGGAIGNLLDRFYQGPVTDFLHVHWQDKIADFNLFGRNFRFALSWPAFNIADSAITCGALFLMLVILFSPKKTG